MSQPEDLEQISLFDDIEVVRNYEQGKDELNLAEFPICSIYKLRDPSIKTLEFEDQITDKETGENINRKLTITAADKWGLPSSFDDEIILALIQLTKLQGYRDRKVYFTKRKILQIMGWDTGGKNTKRVEESLNRWLGVTLQYNNAWRNKETGKWDSSGFHIIEHLYLKEEQLNPEGEGSYIVWNERLLSSMQAGNLKSLDFGIFKELKCPTAKRIFRFLDKRFFHRRSLRFDLFQFARQKIGYDKRYGPAELKRKLAAGIKELEEIGYLKPMSDAERYRKGDRRNWNIYFEKGVIDQKPLPIETEQITELETKMIAIGVTKSRAKKLFDTHSEEVLALKIEHLEFLMSRPETKPINPAGFFVKSITDDYEAPEGFVSEAEKEKERQKRAKKREANLKREKAHQEAQKKKEEAEQAAEAVKEARVEAYLFALGEEGREKFIEECYATARNNPNEASWIDKEGVLGDFTRKAAIQDRVLAILDGKSPSPS